MYFQTTRISPISFDLSDSPPIALTFSIPKNLSLPSVRKGPASMRSLSRGVCWGALGSFLVGDDPVSGLDAPYSIYRENRQHGRGDHRPSFHSANPPIRVLNVTGDVHFHRDVRIQTNRARAHPCKERCHVDDDVSPALDASFDGREMRPQLRLGLSPSVQSKGSWERFGRASSDEN